MDFSALRYFHETARIGSIRKAAETLRVTPSAISRQIAALEHDFGAPLFERSTQGMRLTAAGEVLVRQTQRTFRDFERVRAAIDDLRGLRRGQVTAYVPEGLIAEFLPKALAEFGQRYPAIAFNIFIASTDRIVEATVNDETDIGITFNGPQRADLATIVEHREPLRCLVSADHPLAGSTEVDLATLLDFPLALPEVSFGMRRMIDIAFRGVKSSSPVQILNTNSLELAKRLAATGAAVAFMPGFMVTDEVARGTLRALKVRTPVFTGSCISVCVHRDRELSFAVKEFLRFLKEKFEALPPVD